MEQITQENYRDFDAVNYSKLSSLAGHPSDVKRERDFSDGMKRGDLLDLFCYQGEDAVHEKYYVSSLTQMPSDKVIEIIKACPNYEDGTVIQTARDMGFGGANWKDSTILGKITENGGAEYMFELENAGDKTIISFEEFTEMQQASNLVMNHQFTEDMFGPEWQYQVPLTCKLPVREDVKIQFKCLLDGSYIKEDEDRAIVHDLKYTSSPLNYFSKEFKRWKYYLQASLYSDVVREIFKKPVTYYIVVYSSIEEKVQKFHITDAMLDCGRQGYKDFSYFRKGYKQLAIELKWHELNDKWDYPYDVYQNNGVTEISPDNL